MTQILYSICVTVKKKISHGFDRYGQNERGKNDLIEYPLYSSRLGSGLCSCHDRVGLLRIRNPAQLSGGIADARKQVILCEYEKLRLWLELGQFLGWISEALNYPFSMDPRVLSFWQGE
jgi:hypothetical protein